MFKMVYIQLLTIYLSRLQAQNQSWHVWNIILKNFGSKKNPTRADDLADKTARSPGISPTLHNSGLLDCSRWSQGVAAYITQHKDSLGESQTLIPLSHPLGLTSQNCYSNLDPNQTEKVEYNHI
ncbi:hypothetical protein R6Q59_003796 [Mikania micrantha]